MNCTIPASIGELIDKITILEIKNDKLKSSEALKNVEIELNFLNKTKEKLNLNSQIQSLKETLFDTNLSLWNVCDQRRNLDRDQSFGHEYVELSKLEYKLNDKRALIKKRINDLSNSQIKEEKSYKSFNEFSAIDSSFDFHDYILKGRKVINDEIHGLIKLNSSLDKKFISFCEKIKITNGKIIFCGIGKSGHIAKKLSATFSSLGISSIFLHATEALHGDMGVIKEGDCLILISKSGEASEFPPIYFYCKKKKVTILGITFGDNSSLIKLIGDNNTLLLPDTGEACSLGLAPTTSAIVTLAIGDAVAVTVSESRNVTENKFAEMHPAGKIGKMLTPVSQVMHKDVPIIKESELNFKKLLETFIQGRFGIVGIVDNQQKLKGIISDYDLRKIIDEGKMTSSKLSFNKNFYRLNKNKSLGEAAKFLKEKRIISCFVLEEESLKVIGLLSVYDVLEIV